MPAYSGYPFHAIGFRRFRTCDACRPLRGSSDDYHRPTSRRRTDCLYQRVRAFFSSRRASGTKCAPPSAEDAQARFRTVRDRIDVAFTAWLKERFGTLHNQPPLPPVMTHHVPRMLARTLEESADAKSGNGVDGRPVARSVSSGTRCARRCNARAGVSARIALLGCKSRTAAPIEPLCSGSRACAHAAVTKWQCEASRRQVAALWDEQ